MHIRIHTGRYVNLDRNVRMYQVCDTNDVEDELIFVQVFIVCLIKTDVYQKVSRPSVFKLAHILSTKNKSEVYKVSRYKPKP